MSCYTARALGFPFTQNALGFPNLPCENTCAAKRLSGLKERTQNHAQKWNDLPSFFFCGCYFFKSHFASFCCTNQSGASDTCTADMWLCKPQTKSRYICQNHIRDKGEHGEAFIIRLRRQAAESSPSCQTNLLKYPTCP